mmetsp:Transcript_22857/g.49452  ORF Transcript_22857/g.49452 Transcript_22857/m.49452 type:complete len:166 (-) Transcript_22857:9-506(-)
MMEANINIIDHELFSVETISLCISDQTKAYPLQTKAALNHEKYNTICVSPSPKMIHVFYAFFNTTCAPFNPASSTLFPKSSILAGGYPLVNEYGSIPACDPICCPNSLTGASKFTLTTSRFPFSRRMAMDVVGLDASSVWGDVALVGFMTPPEEEDAAGADAARG